MLVDAVPTSPDGNASPLAPFGPEREDRVTRGPLAMHWRRPAGISHDGADGHRSPATTPFLCREEPANGQTLLSAPVGGESGQVEGGDQRAVI